MYRLEISPAADRDLERIKGRMRLKAFERLRDAVRSLAEEPRPRGVRKIRGADRAYRIRVGDYRVVYDINDSQNLVLILHISRRSETTYRRQA